MSIDAIDRKLIAATQGGLPLAPAPYAEVASWLGLSEDEVIGRLDAMQREGIIRRVALAPNHYALGLMANGAGGDPAAVAFDAVEAGRARGRDVVIVDTAGRLHTQSNLMEELSKVRRVIEGRIQGAPHETLLVVDATTGQNGLQQARLFGETAGVTGVALTKLDGSAKGGVAVAIAYELALPVKLVGVGEGLDDLRPFDPREFARALVAGE